ncbi:MAG: outer membrane protein assembly factor BamE [Ostreibacterium sp.]
MMNICNLVLLTSLTLSAIACNSIPYRIDVDQGNVIDQQMLSQVQIGMSKSQVQQVLGNPLLIDTFHQDRWDYIQYYKSGHTQKIQQGAVSLFFTKTLLSRIQADKLTKITPEELPYRTTLNQNK